MSEQIAAAWTIRIEKEKENLLSFFFLLGFFPFLFPECGKCPACFNVKRLFVLRYAAVYIYEMPLFRVVRNCRWFPYGGNPVNIIRRRVEIGSKTYDCFCVRLPAVLYITV